MHSSAFFTVSALAATALAADHSVRVGGPNSELTFTPNVINASLGDTVTFKFWPKNHSVAQATFNAPCQPANNSFWSGFFPTKEGANEQVFVYTVANESAPVWFYCTQGQHCQNGMVGVINPPASGQRTIQAFAAAAKDAPANVSPSSEKGTGGEIKANSNSSTSPSSSPSSSSGSGDSPSPTTSGAANTASSTGAAAALQVGKGLAFTGVFALLGFFV